MMLRRHVGWGPGLRLGMDVRQGSGLQLRLALGWDPGRGGHLELNGRGRLGLGLRRPLSLLLGLLFEERLGLRRVPVLGLRLE